MPNKSNKKKYPAKTGHPGKGRGKDEHMDEDEMMMKPRKKMKKQMKGKHR